MTRLKVLAKQICHISSDTIVHHSSGNRWEMGCWGGLSSDRTEDGIIELDDFSMRIKLTNNNALI